jgi:hypothetical protein
LVAAAALASGCGSVDPTDPSHFTDVSVRNDTAARVVIVQCDTTCGTLHDRTTLAPGRAATVSVSNEDIAVEYAVEQPSGRRLGCLHMRFERVRRPPDVAVSSLRRCR